MLSLHVTVHQIDSEYNLKITDFGTAYKTDRNFASVIESHNMRGTYCYMAPEMLSNNSKSFACDIYSYGCVLYEIIHRKHPWHDMQVQSDANIRKQLDNNILPSFSKDLQATVQQDYKLKVLSGIMMECWAKNPLVRPSFDKIVAKLKLCKK